MGTGEKWLDITAPMWYLVNNSYYIWIYQRGPLLEKEELSSIRNRLNKTQKQLAQLLATSEKAIQNYEQGWRNVPAHVERQIFFLLSQIEGKGESRKACWEVKNCPIERRLRCPTWEFKTGKMCWLTNGIICEGTVQRNWQQKMKICRSCKILASLF